LKEEALDCIKWRNRFGGGCGPVVWQITDDNEQTAWRWLYKTAETCGSTTRMK
jgi:hypothetical protein